MKKESSTIKLQKLFCQGLFPSMTACAGHYRVNHTTLRDCLKSKREFVGGGRKGSAFAADEEKKLVNFVSDQLSVGCGIDFKQLSMVKKGEKRKCKDGSDLPQVVAPVVAPAGVSVPAQTPARKRGRPKKNLPDDQLDQSKSLDDMFAKKKR